MDTAVQTRYQGVDWRDKSTWGCNQRENPFNGAAVDDVTLHPMELMFVKVKYWGIVNRYPSMRTAAQYDLWKVRAVQCTMVCTAYRYRNAGFLGLILSI